MYDLFVSILNMSFYSSLVILCVLGIRLLLKSSPKVFAYALWSVVLFRLLCPFTLESTIGMFSSSSASAPSIIENKVQQENGVISSGNFLINNNTSTVEITTGLNYSLVEIGLLIWIIGILAMLGYSVIQLINLKKKLLGATPFSDNIYIADHIKSPFVIGVIAPKIYLPSNIFDGEKNYIVAHEKHHIKRLDHITRILGFIALILHWFNPLVWVAFILSGKDMEMSCDEAVMKKMDRDIRVEYSQSLLHFASNKKLIKATPLAFGEGDTKERVKNVIKYKKPTIWVSIVAIIIVICVVVILGTNQKGIMTVQEGTYYMVVENDEYKEFSRIVLENGMFEFSYDMAKSYLPYGKYEIKNEKLVLETYDGLFKYIFKIDGNNLIFQEDGSSSTDRNIGEKVVDGSVFYLESK